jgi:hypothetical protein
MLIGFPPLIVCASLALLVGLCAGQRLARNLLLGALMLAGLSLIALHLIGGWTLWLSIYAMLGLSGPALFRNRIASVITSIATTVLMLTAGTMVLVALACEFGDCL